MLDDQRLALQLRGQLTRGQERQGFSEVLLRNWDCMGMGSGVLPVSIGKIKCGSQPAGVSANSRTTWDDSVTVSQTVENRCAIISCTPSLRMERIPRKTTCQVHIYRASKWLGLGGVLKSCAHVVALSLPGSFAPLSLPRGLSLFAPQDLYNHWQLPENAA